MSIRFWIFALMLVASAARLLVPKLMGERVGDDPGLSVFWQGYLFIRLLSGVSGAAAARRQMVHEKMSRPAEDAQRNVREMFSVLLLIRLVVGVGFLILPAHGLALVTGLDVSIFDERNVRIARLLAFVVLSELFLDVAEFTVLSQGWLAAQAIGQVVIVLARIAGLYFFPDAVEGMVIALAIGQCALACVFLAVKFRREHALCVIPLLVPRSLASGFRRMLPTATLGVLIMSIDWMCNWSLGRSGDSSEEAARLVALFALTAPLLIQTGVLLSVPNNNTYGVLASDGKRTMEERQRLVAEGFAEGISWTLGITAIMWAVTPWMISAFYSRGEKLDGGDLATMTTIMYWQAPVVGRTILYTYCVQAAIALDLRAQLLKVSVVAIGLSACVLALCPNPWRIEVTSLVSGVSGLAASLVFFFLAASKTFGPYFAFVRRKALRALAGALIAGGVALGGMLVIRSTWQLENWMLDIGVLGAVCAAAFVLHGFVTMGKDSLRFLRLKRG